MKKKIVALLCAGMMVFGMTGCGEQEQVDYLKSEIVRLTAEQTELQQSVNTLKEIEDAEKERTGTATYVVVLNIGQTHYSLDLNEYMKDQMNELELPIPVSKEFYDSVRPGDVIDNSFRSGSLMFKGSLGAWDITVADKYIE